MTSKQKNEPTGTVCETPRKSRNCGIRIAIAWALEIAFLVLGMLSGGIYPASRIDSYLASHSALERFEASEPSVPVETRNDEAGVPVFEPDFLGWSDGRVKAYMRPAAQQSSLPLAVLEIPKIHLKVPVFDGTDGLTLNHAVGHIAGTARPGEQGNIGIAGHRDGFFRALKEIAPGDRINLKTRGATDRYIVDHIQIVSPRDVGVLKPQERPAITLVTCYPFQFLGSAPKRFVVTAYLEERSAAGSTTSEDRLNHQPNNPALEEQ